MGMKKNPNPLPKPKARLHVDLDLWHLDRVPDARDALVSGILKLAPTSPLYPNPGMKDTVDALSKSYADYQQFGAQVNGLRKQLASVEQSWAASRYANDACILAVKSLTEAGAATEADIVSMSFLMRHTRSAQSEPPPVDSIDVKLGRKGSGRATVKAHETGTAKWYYEAESSPDPMGPDTWTTLIGDGKQRKLTGKSGTSVWVRFARKRGSKQTEWSTPVLITFP